MYMSGAKTRLQNVQTFPALCLSISFVLSKDGYAANRLLLRH
jgi:hypothetical protein